MPEALIVACPGCRKRYSIPPGASPGQFQCQDCSAVVPYGQRGGASPGPAPAKAAAAPHRGGKPGGGAKHHGRRRHGRDEEEGDDRGGRAEPKKKDPTLFLLAIAGGVIAIVILAVVLSKDSGRKKAAGGGGVDRPALAGTGERGGAPFDPSGTGAPEAPGGGGQEPPKVPTAMDVVAAGTGTPAGTGPAGGVGGTAASRAAGGEEERKHSFKRAANAPSGGNFGKDSDTLRAMMDKDWKSVVTDFDHLSDTPEELRKQIDADVAIIANPDAGRESLVAADRLVKVGRPAIPKVIGVFSRLDFTKYANAVEARDACVVADAVDGILREATNWTRITPLQYNVQAKPSTYKAVIRNWYVWWLNRGFEESEYPKPKPRAGEEEKE